MRLSILLSERPCRKSYSASSFVNLVYVPVLLRKITLRGCFNAAYLAMGTLLLFQADVRYPMLWCGAYFAYQLSSLTYSLQQDVYPSVAQSD